MTEKKPPSSDMLPKMVKAGCPPAKTPLEPPKDIIKKGFPPPKPPPPPPPPKK